MQADENKAVIGNRSQDIDLDNAAVEVPDNEVKQIRAAGGFLDVLLEVTRSSNMARPSTEIDDEYRSHL